ncbi:MAG: hypothetical protein C4321_02895 [Chloroflexota bacterium]
MNSQAAVFNSSGLFVQWLQPSDFNDASGRPVLTHNQLFAGSSPKVPSGGILRLYPGVYYFYKIDLWSKGVTPEGGSSAYTGNSDAVDVICGTPNGGDDLDHRVTIFVDAAVSGGVPIASYTNSTLGNGLRTLTPQGAGFSAITGKGEPGNLRIYAKNTGDFRVYRATTANSANNVLNFYLLHLDYDGATTRQVILNTGSNFYGSILAYRIRFSGGPFVEQWNTGSKGSKDPLIVSYGSGTWKWKEIQAGP